MAGQNDFLIFDEGKDNILTQELYAEDSDRTGGFKTGLARSNVNNKVLHQTSMLCHALGEIIKDKGLNASDNGTVEELKQALLTAFSTQGVVETIYPVGSIYLSVNSVDPATLLGFGTWEQIKDKFLLASGDTYAIGDVGGESAVSLTTEQLAAHSHGASSVENGGHSHTRGSMDITGFIHVGGSSQATCFPIHTRDSSGALSSLRESTTVMTRSENKSGFSGHIRLTASNGWSGSTSTNGSHAHTINIATQGNSDAHNNMPPYLVVNVWQRIA